MAEPACACCGPSEASTTDKSGAASGWIAERPVTATPLPEAMAAVLSRFYSVDSVTTLGEFVDANRVAAGGGAIDVADLCHSDEATPHVARTAGETYHFQCFYDGIALSQLVDEPVSIRTESPAGHPIEVETTPDGDVDATPADAVLSFGIAADAGDAEGDPALEDVYANVCPYVRAFRSREAYEAWAARVDAATVGMALTAGVPVAAGLAE